MVRLEMGNIGTKCYLLHCDRFSPDYSQSQCHQCYSIHIRIQRGSFVAVDSLIHINRFTLAVGMNEVLQSGYLSGDDASSL